MIEQFIERTFKPDSVAIIDTARQICDEYGAQGLNLTLRQLYYQFVSRDLIPNSDRSYKRLGSIVNDGRLAGLLDWSHLQDRGRNVRGSFWGYDDPGDYISGLADGYVEAVWEGQQYRPEVWVEKEALIDIIARGCAATRVPYFACKGYVSQSEMYEAAKRFQRRRRAGLTPVVIHLGDHDPSGIDMTRDIRDRLELMSWGDIEIRRIALNMDQVEQYEPPPNPAKLTDSRGTGYVERFGYESWELDALDPATLNDLIESAIADYIDQDAFDEAVEQERQGQESIAEVADHWAAIRERWDDVADLLGVDR